LNKIKTTIINYEEFTSIDFKPPSVYFIKNALNEYIFYHTKDRATAQEESNKEYGSGHYKVCAAKIAKNRKDLTCTGTATRKK
jgi:hypothetical protein